MTDWQFAVGDSCISVTVHLGSIMSDCYWYVAFVLQGITNTIGAVPGIVGVALTGYLLDATHSWSVCHQSIFVGYIKFYEIDLITILVQFCMQISLFAPSIFFYLTGTVVWLAFASSKPQDFSKSGPESWPMVPLCKEGFSQKEISSLV